VSILVLCVPVLSMLMLGRMLILVCQQEHD
jgi:hypothetical protein